MGLSPYLVGSDAVGSDLTVREKKEEDRFFIFYFILFFIFIGNFIWFLEKYIQ